MARLTEDELVKLLDDQLENLEEKEKEYSDMFKQPLIGSFLADMLMKTVNKLGEAVNPHPQDMILALAVVMTRIKGMVEIVDKHMENK